MVSEKKSAEVSGKNLWINVWNGVSSLLDFFAVLENLGVVDDKSVSYTHLDVYKRQVLVYNLLTKVKYIVPIPRLERSDDEYSVARLP